MVNKNQIALQFDDVCVAYDTRTVLNGISLCVEKGQLIAIMGGSGSGKTTLLRAATGQVALSRGRAHLLGVDVSEASGAQLVNVRKKVGVLFQHGALLTDLSVFENVAFPLREHYPRMTATDLLTKVLATLESVGLRAAAHLQVHQISGGMARRVALARAIVMDPEVIFFDEPFAGLDPISLGVTARLIRRVTDQLGCASIMITHDVPESFAIVDHVYMIAQGHVLAQGAPDDLNRSDQAYVQQFLGGLPDGPIQFDYPVSPEFERWLQDMAL